MRFAIWDHAGKGAYLRARLLEAGHQAAETIDDTDLLLVDCDWSYAHPRPELIQAASKAGAKIVQFPHGGHPTVFVYDGLTVPDPLVDLRLEHGPGSIRVAELLGLELRQEATGWLYSPTRPFQPVPEPRRVLFAPQHPNMEALLKGTNGHDPAPALNQRVYKQLLSLGFELTVSMVGPAWRNGIWAHPRAHLFENPGMLFEHSYRLVQDADLVVGAGTVAVTAVASGKPTVMLGQSNYADYIDGAYTLPDHWQEYDGLLRYPVDTDDDDLGALISRVCAGDTGAARWRTDYVGDDGTGNAIRLLERLVSSTANGTISLEDSMTEKPEKDSSMPEPPVKHVTVQGVPAKAGAKGKAG